MAAWLDVGKVGLQLLLTPSISSPIVRVAGHSCGLLYPCYATFKAMEELPSLAAATAPTTSIPSLIGRFWSGPSAPLPEEEQQASSSGRDGNCNGNVNGNGTGGGSSSRRRGDAGGKGMRGGSNNSSSISSGGECERRRWLTYWLAYGFLSLAEAGIGVDRLSRVPLYYHARLAFLLWLQHPRTQGAEKIYGTYVRPLLLRYQPKLDIILHHMLAAAALVYSSYEAPIHAAHDACMAMVAQTVAFAKWFNDTPDTPPHPPATSALAAIGEELQMPSKRKRSRAGEQFIVS